MAPPVVEPHCACSRSAASRIVHLHIRHQIQNCAPHFALARLTAGGRVASPYVVADVDAKALPALFGTVRGQRTAATQVVTVHSLQSNPIMLQHRFHTNAVLERAEIHPGSHDSSTPLARS